ncbi:hypothetical protein [Tardiphaga sp. 709]|uniref:hypothetical protein n=1 Tax=Tardiphaga sp. 709 TaxID=3076039 RepID=UPI0028F10ABF|nr:hypothetical protein [Tardiphaga sp. 709]WNV10109.1 hypothetical protein RSO67_02615 [Tardiphaga sp. 709]
MDEGEWLSITVAAERLTAAGDAVDRSTLSRYVKQHSEALLQRREGKSNLVEFSALAAHRTENVRLRKPVPSFSPAASPASPSAQQAMRFPGSQSDGTARKAQADAAIRELDLAERLGKLTLVSEVDKSGRNAIALMQSAFERAIEGEASAASVKYGWDERIARIVLKAFARKGVEVFHTEMLKYLDALNRGEMAAEQDDDRSPIEAASLQ